MGLPIARTPIRVWVLTTVAFLGCTPVVTAGIIDSSPPDGAVDARWPHAPGDVSMRFGWTGVDLVFDEPVALMLVSDFIVTEDGGDSVAPVIRALMPLDANTVRLELDSALEPGTWTTITHAPSGTSTRVGFLPGDVDGSGTSTSADVLALIDAINGPLSSGPIYAVDIDRSGVVDEADVVALKDILEGTASFSPWLSQTISPAGNGDPRGLAPQAEIQLVPSHPGPFLIGERISVELLVRRLAPADTVYLRLMQFAFQDTDPQLTLAFSGLSAGHEFWDYSSTPLCQTTPPSCGAGYWEFGGFTGDMIISTVYAGFSEAPNAQLPLLGDTTPTRMAYVDVIMPWTPGVFRLDALHAGATNIDFGARLDFGFDWRTTWTAYAGTITGGQLDLVVETLQPGRGACCDGYAICTDDVAQGDCQSEGDVWFDQTFCEDVVPACEVTMGACCDRSPGAGGACRESIEATCQGPNEVWTYLAVCQDVSCTEVLGACCDGVSGSCLDDRLIAQCQGPHATWYQEASCSSFTCDLLPGACCDSHNEDPLSRSGACVDNVFYTDCRGAGQNWFKGRSCRSVLDLDECPADYRPIPTVSQWGLVIIAIALLVIAKVYSPRRLYPDRG